MFADLYHGGPPPAAPSRLSRWVRRSHRWIAMFFTLTVAANFVSMAFGPPPAWIAYAPLLPLLLLLVSGLYLFALPYFRRQS